MFNVCVGLVSLNLHSNFAVQSDLDKLRVCNRSQSGRPSRCQCRTQLIFSLQCNLCQRYVLYFFTVANKEFSTQYFEHIQEKF